MSTKITQNTDTQFVHYFLIICLILTTCRNISCEPQIGVSNKTHQQIIIPATVIERSDPLPNGCYNQTIREPDYTDLSRFIYTEQLICPPGVNMTAMIHKHARPATVYGPHPITSTQNGNPNLVLQPIPMHNYNTTYPLTPVNATHQIVIWPTGVSPPSGSMPIAVTEQKYQPSIVAPPRPTENPNLATSQVMVLSQKTGHYAKERKVNAAKSLYAVETFVFISLFLLWNFV
ncbi:uncharacterized protein [Musca autumnalis]|uniref:uncharacterized protein n=1 Tax=Musca autumnalis TaxID=221902 RepID=UPI003CEC5572